MILEFLLIILIVGIVTAGLNIKFDRFLTIIPLLFISNLVIFDAVNIFLWIILLGSLTILLANRERISAFPKAMKLKLFILVPVLTAAASLIGSFLFSISSQYVLVIALGIIAALYGLRLVFLHFKPHELDLQDANPLISRLCGFFGPVLSGLSVGFIGTSLKPLKIPFAVKVGKMNLKQVYLGNVVTTFFASSFAILWHFFMTKGMTSGIFYQQLLLGAALWTGIHYVSEMTNIFFKDSFRKNFQIIVGLVLLAVSFRIFMMI